jgi:hypothetical protein
MTILEDIRDDIEYPFKKLYNIADMIGEDVYDGGKYVVNKVKSGIEIVEGVGEAGFEIGKTVLKTSEIIALILVGGFILVQIDNDLLQYRKNRK